MYSTCTAPHVGLWIAREDEHDHIDVDEVMNATVPNVSRPADNVGNQVGAGPG